MVVSVDRVSAMRESSVEDLGCRERVGVIFHFGSVRRAPHQGMERKCGRDGS